MEIALSCRMTAFKYCLAGRTDPHLILLLLSIVVILPRTQIAECTRRAGAVIQAAAAAALKSWENRDIWKRTFTLNHSVRPMSLSGFYHNAMQERRNGIPIISWYHTEHVVLLINRLLIHHQRVIAAQIKLVITATWVEIDSIYSGCSSDKSRYTETVFLKHFSPFWAESLGSELRSSCNVSRLLHLTTHLHRNLKSFLLELQSD